MNRVLEIPICIAAGVLMLPFFLLACMVVFATLGRPLFFSQVRAGRNGQTFILTKLRSMTDDRDASGVLLPDRQRQTPFTTIVRRLRADEVPQLISILRGDMALVGPRPLMPETIGEFGGLGQLRCAIRPGLTGWAQVSGNTNLSNPEKLHLDLWYAAHRSTALDFRIMAETIAVAFRGEHRREDRIGQAEQWVSHADLQQLQGSMA